MPLKTALALGVLAFGLLGSSAAWAAETITYTYDARGRLIKVVHTGNVNNNVQACYKYDKADNRVNVTTTTSPPLPPCPS
jgi:YD repeat-containing protein